MGEPVKLFTVLMPYKAYEKIKTIARRDEKSVNKTVYQAITEYLEKREGVKL